MSSRLYFAYGANTNIESMLQRCPKARPVSAAVLRDWRLVFRGVADVVREKGFEVHGALWRITPACEAALDRFEGYPSLYIKALVRLRVHGESQEVMLYVMRDREYSEPPSRYYEDLLRRGYADFGLPQLQLDDAVKRAMTAARVRERRAAEAGLAQWRRDMGLTPSEARSFDPDVRRVPGLGLVVRRKNGTDDNER